MGLPQGLGKPLRGLPHFQHPSAHLLFPLRLSPFPEGKIFWRNTLTGGLDYQRVYFHFSAVIIACPKEICKPSGQASCCAYIINTFSLSQLHAAHASLVLLLLLLPSDLRIGKQLPRLFKQREQTLRQAFFQVVQQSPDAVCQTLAKAAFFFQLVLQITVCKPPVIPSIRFVVSETTTRTPLP